MTLQKTSAGALLMLDDGDLMRECCCEDPYDCENCDAPLDDEYTVTMSGFTGTWTAFNGDWVITHTSECEWAGSWTDIDEYGHDLSITMSWEDTPDPGVWKIVALVSPVCGFLMRIQAATPCGTPPTGSYTQDNRSALCSSSTPDPLVLSVS
jgi:hypothetical protein